MRIVASVVDDVVRYWPVHLLGIAMGAVGWVAVELCDSRIADERWAPELTFGVVVALCVTGSRLGRRLRRRIDQRRAPADGG